MSKQTKLYLLRHGEAANNIRENYIAGRSNELPLTPKGLNQSKRLGEGLLKLGITPDSVLSSPAERARQTGFAALAAMELELPIKNEDRLQEQDTGEWTGCRATDIFTNEMLEMIDASGNDFRPPGGESFNDIGERMYSWVNTLDHNDNIFAFTHGGAIRCLASHIHGWSHDKTYQTRPQNASVSLFVKSAVGWQLEYIGKDIGEMEKPE